VIKEALRGRDIPVLVADKGGKRDRTKRLAAIAKAIGRPKRLKLNLAGIPDVVDTEDWRIWASP
jgi:hypothetical protein